MEYNEIKKELTKLKKQINSNGTTTNNLTLDSTNVYQSSDGQFTKEQRDQLVQFLEDRAMENTIWEEMNLTSKLSELAIANLEKKDHEYTIASQRGFNDKIILQNDFEEYVKDAQHPAELAFSLSISPYLHLSEEKPNDLNEIEIPLHVYTSTAIFGRAYSKVKLQWYFTDIVYEDRKSNSSLTIVCKLIAEDDGTTLYETVMKGINPYDNLTISLISQYTYILTSEPTTSISDPDLGWSSLQLQIGTKTLIAQGYLHVTAHDVNGVTKPGQYQVPLMSSEIIYHNYTRRNIVESGWMTKDHIPKHRDDIEGVFTILLTFPISEAVTPDSVPPMTIDGMNILLDPLRQIQDARSAIKACESQINYYNQVYLGVRQEWSEMHTGDVSSLSQDMGAQIQNLATEMSKVTKYEKKNYTIPTSGQASVLVSGWYSVFDKTSTRWASVYLNQVEFDRDKGTVHNRGVGRVWNKRGIQSDLNGNGYPSWMERRFVFPTKNEYVSKTITLTSTYDDGNLFVVRVNPLRPDWPLDHKIDKIEESPHYHCLDVNLDDVFTIDEDNKIHLNYEYHTKWVNSNRSPSVHFKLPSAEIEIEEIFYGIAGLAGPPVIQNMTSAGVKIFTGFNTFETTVIGLQPGEYLTADGQKWYGVHILLGEKRFTTSGFDVQYAQFQHKELNVDKIVYKSSFWDVGTHDDSHTGGSTIFDGEDITELTYGDKMRLTGKIRWWWVYNDTEGSDGKAYLMLGDKGDKEKNLGIEYIPEDSIDHLKFSNKHEGPELVYNGSKLPITDEFAGAYYSSIIVTFSDKVHFQVLAPIPPVQIPQASVYSSMSDDILSSIAQIAANVENLQERVTNLEYLVQQLQQQIASMKEGDMIDLIVSVFGTVAQYGLKFIRKAIAIYNKVKSAIKTYRNVQSRTRAIVAKTGRIKNLYKNQKFAQHISSEAVDARQTLKNGLIQSQGKDPIEFLELRTKNKDDLSDLVENEKAAYFNDLVRAEAEIRINTGFSKTKDIDNALKANKLDELAIEPGAMKSGDIPMNYVEFRSTPLDKFGDTLGAVGWKVSSKNKNPFDGVACDNYLKNTTRPVHAYTRSNVFAINPATRELECDMTICGVAEGAARDIEKSKLVNAVTINTVVKGRTSSHGHLLEVRPWAQQTEMTEDQLDYLCSVHLGTSYEGMDNDARLRALFNWYNTRDMSRSRLDAKVYSPDPDQVTAVGKLASQMDWKYNIFRNNCQNFNRMMYNWMKHGEVPSNMYSDAMAPVFERYLINTANKIHGASSMRAINIVREKYQRNIAAGGSFDAVAFYGEVLKVMGAS